MSDEPIHTFDQAILSAWQAELKATGDATLKQQCLEREQELLPRFAEHYQQLKALRRRVRQSLQRQWKRSLAGLALLIVLGQAPALAATINVGGACTGVRAMVAANNDTTASGNCTKGAGADSIVLPRNSMQTLTRANNIHPDYGSSGLPIVCSKITIDGNGSTIRRTSDIANFRILTIADNGNLTLQQTTVSGGDAEVSEIGNVGGGILNYHGRLNIIVSTICRKHATLGGGIHNEQGRLTVTVSTISETRLPPTVRGSSA